MKIIEISANNNMSYYVNASEIEAVEISESTVKNRQRETNIIKSDTVYFFQAVVFLKSGKILFDNELFSNKIDIYKKYFTGERNGQ